MSFEDISHDIAGQLPELRGTLKANAPLAPFAWFRVGGLAQLLFSPADEADLAYFLGGLPEHLSVTILGLASNVIIRDGGVPGVVVRMGRGFNSIETEEGNRLRVGASVPDVRVAMAAAKAGIDGLSFYRGIPGSIGGALRMNAGAHAGETRDFLVEARALDRQGKIHLLDNAAMGYGYRHCSVADEFIFTEALFEGQPGHPDELELQMQDVVDYRQQKQPVKSRTGGSTFKNPQGMSSWKLIDEAGCRGLRIGGAHVSAMHCNFLINDQDATAADIEQLGETVRQRVLENSGVDLHWEIRRVGIALERHERTAAA